MRKKRELRRAIERERGRRNEEKERVEKSDRGERKNKKRLKTNTIVYRAIIKTYFKCFDPSQTTLLKV